MCKTIPQFKDVELTIKMNNWFEISFLGQGLVANIEVTIYKKYKKRIEKKYLKKTRDRTRDLLLFGSQSIA